MGTRIMKTGRVKQVRRTCLIATCFGALSTVATAWAVHVLGSPLDGPTSQRVYESDAAPVLVRVAVGFGWTRAMATRRVIRYPDAWLDEIAPSPASGDVPGWLADELLASGQLGEDDAVAVEASGWPFLCLTVLLRSDLDPNIVVHSPTHFESVWTWKVPAPMTGIDVGLGDRDPGWPIVLPVRVLLRPFLMNLAVHTVFWLLVLPMTSDIWTRARAMWSSHKRAVRTRSGQCPCCGYSLAHGGSTTCPECGYPGSESH